MEIRRQSKQGGGGAGGDRGGERGVGITNGTAVKSFEPSCSFRWIRAHTPLRKGPVDAHGCATIPTPATAASNPSCGEPSTGPPRRNIPSTSAAPLSSPTKSSPAAHQRREHAHAINLPLHPSHQVRGHQGSCHPQAQSPHLRRPLRSLGTQHRQETPTPNRP